MKKVFLSEICDIQIGRTPSRAISNYWGEGESWVSIADLNNRIFINSTKESITHEAIQKCNCKRIPTNTVLFSFKLSIGKVAITQKPLFTNEAIAALLPLRKKDFFPEYLYYALNSLNLDGVTDRAVMGQTLNKKKLARIQIPLCPLKDQKQIVQILDTADTLRQKRKEQLNLLDDYLKSVFFEMFGYPVLNDKEWETTDLDSVIDSIDSGWSPVCLDTQRRLDEIPVILKLGAVTYCYFNPKNHKVIPSNKKIEKRVEVKKLDLLFTRKNTKELVAASAFVFDCERNLLLPDTIFRLNYKKELVKGIYLWKLFVEEGFRRVIQNLATGSAGSMPNISKEKLRRLLIPIPPIELQNKFASIVEQVEQTKQKMCTSLDEMDNHFNALMQRYFG